MPSNKPLTNPSPLPGEVFPDEKSTESMHYEEQEEQSQSFIDPLDRHIEFSSNSQNCSNSPQNPSNSNPVAENYARPASPEPDSLDRPAIIFVGPHRHHSFTRIESLLKPEPTGQGSAPVSLQELKKPPKRSICICQ